MQNAATRSPRNVFVSGPTAWRQQAACTLDEAKGAACLSLVLSSLLTSAGFGHTGRRLLSRVGVPVWCGDEPPASCRPRNAHDHRKRSVFAV
jgi:hypothetical protein